MITEKQKERLKLQAMYQLNEEKKLGLLTRKEFWVRAKEAVKAIEGDNND